jgi:hypothetical protein
MEEARRAGGGLESLPDFIALPPDEDSRPIIPTSRVTALVEARDAWASELGMLDAINRAITRGQLVMQRVSAPSQLTALRNHPSWEKDEDAKRALGPVIAMWLASGVLEYVALDDNMPVLLQPCGAVPKGTVPFYRLITDARFANKFYSDWEVTYTTAAQLSSTLNRQGVVHRAGHEGALSHADGEARLYGALVRGKALHYGCAILFFRVAAQSLSQLMHNWEKGTGPVAVPSLDDEKEVR